VELERGTNADRLQIAGSGVTAVAGSTVNPKGQLTSVDVALQVSGHSVAGVVELQVQAEAQKRGVLLHQVGDLHLDLVAQHRRSLRREIKEFSGVIDRVI